MALRGTNPELYITEHTSAYEDFPETEVEKHRGMHYRRWQAGPTFPVPYTLHPTPYTLHPTPYTLHPTPHTLRPTPYTLHPTPCTLHPEPYTLHPEPYTLHSAR